MKLFYYIKLLKQCSTKLSLVDKWLFAFMLVLILQSTFNLFFANHGGSGIDTVDIIVRTTSAGIFGYFLSSNFAQHSSVEQKEEGINEAEKIIETNQTAEEAPKTMDTQMGFSQTKKDKSLRYTTKAAKLNNDNSSFESSNSIQVMLAGTIGFVCLICLLLWRNIVVFHPDFISSDSASILSQFRDFVSGTVGFLIGTPSTPKK